MRRHYATVDVFTDRLFGGNPLAVVLDADGMAADDMQAVAREFNYAETTFVLPPQDRAHTAHVRIFTPARELPFAGHPNVGTAYVVAQRRGHAGAFVFEEAAGLVPITLLRDGDAVTGAEVTAPVPLARLGTVAAADIAACLKLAESDILTSRHTPETVSVGTPFTVVELASDDALRRARPVLAAFEAAFPNPAVASIYLYTRDVTLGDVASVEARMFAPFDGIPEDPATGSATAAACALFAALEGTDQSLRFAQGREMGRPSRLLATATHTPRGIIATVAGRCFPMMEGSFRLPGDR